MSRCRKGLKTSDTAGLPFEFDFKVGGKYMMTINIDTADGLVNGATGKLRLIQRSPGPNSKPIRVWVELEDKCVGSRMRQNNKTASRNLGISDTWTPIDPVGRIARPLRPNLCTLVQGSAGTADCLSCRCTEKWC